MHLSLRFNSDAAVPLPTWHRGHCDRHWSPMDVLREG